MVVFYIAFKVIFTFFQNADSLPAFINLMRASCPRSQIKNNKSVNWKMKDAYFSII